MNQALSDQRQYFVDSLVPELFFANPEDFLDMLAEGNRYLNFLWARAGEAAGSDSGASEVSGEVVGLAGGYLLGLISLPEPVVEKETLILGLACRPVGLTLTGIQRPAASIFALEAPGRSGSLVEGWILRERSRNGSTRTLEQAHTGRERGAFLAAVTSALGL
jgi:hypothetical protein